MKLRGLSVRRLGYGLCAWVLLLFGGSVEAFGPNFELGLEYQWFPNDRATGNANYPVDFLGYAGFEWDRYFSDDRWMFEVDAYVAQDHKDENRSRFDFRTLALSYKGDHFDVRFGVMTEFWGVTESRHLSDILNQTSVADNIDEEVKLGQPMVKWQTHQDWGNLQLFWLPMFRERIYPAPGSRFTPGLDIDEDSSRYASGAKRTHQDFAVRYTNTLEEWDIGLGWFRGTSREPLLEPVLSDSGMPVLSPYYEQIDQASLDLQRTSDGLLLKLEAIYRKGNRQEGYGAAVGGLEFTQVGVLGSAMDLGYIAEYLYDERGDKATTPFQNDLFVGLRLAANNIAQTNLLLGMYQDLESAGRAFRLELTTRLQDGLVLEVEGQAFSGLDSNDLLYSFQDDAYLRTTLRYYF
ncbi:MAG: hypothetical protein PVI92_10805 [Chromatiales bacterium]|jgi:hypothetical protein